MKLWNWIKEAWRNRGTFVCNTCQIRKPNSETWSEGMHAGMCEACVEEECVEMSEWLWHAREFERDKQKNLIKECVREVLAEKV